MKDKHGKVIYVGKSRKLKNRVSQYFQNSRKNYKTERMVRLVEDFEYIVCSTEIEALTLENTLIKQYSPKYNIRLKDAKSYPYIKVTHEQYPRIVYTRTRLSDKAKYYGPFSGTSTVFSVISVLQKTLGIPSCKRQFPRDIGKGRPCVYYQMGQCVGVCTGKVDKADYDELIRCACDILRGNTAEARRTLEARMMQYAEEDDAADADEEQALRAGQNALYIGLKIHKVLLFVSVSYHVGLRFLMIEKIKMTIFSTFRGIVKKLITWTLKNVHKFEV